MTYNRFVLQFLAGGAAALATASAFAQDTTPPAPPSEAAEPNPCKELGMETVDETSQAQDAAAATTEPEPASMEPPPYLEPMPPPTVVTTPSTPQTSRSRYEAMGLTVTAGGGVNDFTDGETRDFTSTGGGWQARLAVGTRWFLAGEVAYIGSANNVTALGLDPDAALIGNGAEAAARVNFLRGTVQPYALAGAGWKHYNVINEDFNTSAIEGSDDVVHFPLGAGVSFRPLGFVADVRGTFRPAVSDDMVADGEGSLTSWAADANIGWEF